MEFLRIVLCTFISLIVLFLLSRLIGNKQISQLNMFDYINGITIGSIAAEMATTLDNAFWKPLVAMVIYALATAMIDFASGKSMTVRRLLEGKAVVLYENGKLYYDGFRVARINLCEFLAQCRSNGYFSLTSLETVILESNGRLSFMPTAQHRPLTPDDIQLYLRKESPAVPVFMDGAALTENLAAIGKDPVWFKNQLKKQNISEEELFLAMAESDGTLAAYKKETTHKKRSRFQ